MNKSTLRAASTVVAVLLASHAALAGDNDVYSTAVDGELGFGKGAADLSLTVTTAVNGDIDKDGIVLRGEGSLSIYTYNNIPTNIDGAQWQGSALVGYQIVRDSISYAAFAGLDYQSISLTPVDLANPARGERAGAKFVVDIETDREKSFYGNLIGNYSTAFDTYFARGRYGWKPGTGEASSRIAFGPEFSALGDLTFNAQRAGAFVYLPVQYDKHALGYLIAAAGYQWVQGVGSNATAPAATGGAEGAYATLSFSVSF
jgi:hypothetical protein